MSREAMKRAFDAAWDARGRFNEELGAFDDNLKRQAFEGWYTAELAKMREPDNAAMIDAKRPVRELGLTQFAIDRQRREQRVCTRCGGTGMRTRNDLAEHPDDVGRMYTCECQRGNADEWPDNAKDDFG